MPRTAEHTVNVELARLLRTRHPRWRQGIGVEQTGVLSDAPAQRPDILIQHPGGLPVVIETEYLPARGVEQDARGRLGAVVAANGEAIEQAVALRVPVELRGVNQAHLPQRVAAAAFDYCVFTEGAESPVRWPESGWLTGGIDDLAGFIEQTALSERRIARGALILETGVRQAAGRLQAMLLEPAGILRKRAAVLHQQPGEQTERMAMAIVANALTFHATLAASNHDVRSFDDLRAKSLLGTLDGHLVIREWRRILREVNYWPIFRIAIDLMSPVPPRESVAILEELVVVANALHQVGTSTTHDLSGQMFGRLITDRKFLATFYTLPASAALLAELAAARLDLDWSDPEAFTSLQVADLACGSGALLAAAYRAVAARHRRAGGDDAPLHASMMEHALIGADIMPAATHLTASTLSSAHPGVPFDRTRIHTMPYGDPEPNDTGGHATAIGSLDLILSDAQPSLFGTGQHAIRGHDPSVIADALPAYARQGDELRVPHGSVDLMIMNPPFTSPTNHAALNNVPIPSFAGFATSEDEQRRMSDVLRGIRRRLEQPVGHGNAGLASNFIDLAHAKVKPGGVLALVLPLAVVSGSAWSSARRLLAREYLDLTVVTIAATGDTNRAFSSDTSIGEALVIATRRERPVDADESAADALHVSLRRRPQSLAEASEVARAIQGLPYVTGGLFGIGDGMAGCFIRATLADSGCAAVTEPGVAQAALALKNSLLKLPRMREAHPLPVVVLADIGRRGLVHRDISGRNSGGSARGPFDVIPRQGSASAYPMLWEHAARRERRLLVEPDTEGRVRQGCGSKAFDVWETATRLHLTLDFRLNSQSLAACLTPERSIGGRAWPNFRLTETAGEEAIALWANTTLGLLSFWWSGGRQQQGRSIMTITQLPDLLTLDVRQLTKDQIERSHRIFADFRDHEFLPANEAYHDPARQALDQAVLIHLLGLPESILEPLTVLRRQWCAEPTVHGGKSTRPPEQRRAVSGPAERAGQWRPQHC